MKVTPKMFICEVPDRVSSEGDCCWIFGSVSEVETGSGGEPVSMVLDDGTSDIRVYFEEDSGETGNVFGLPEYKRLVSELSRKGRCVSVVCQMECGRLRVLHISDSFGRSGRAESDWLSSIIRLRSSQERLPGVAQGFL